MSKVVIFGIGQIADEAYYYLKNDSPHEIVAFTVDRDFSTRPLNYDLPVLPFDEVQSHYPPSEFDMFVAVGYQDLNQLRARKYYEAKDKGYTLISYVSSHASNFGEVEIGDNCFILENAVIQPCSRIGNNVTIWSGNHIGHHASVGDHCFVCGHVVVSGGSVIEPYCFLGVNSTIGHRVTVGRESIVGAGSLVLKDAPAKSVFIAAGTPPYRLDSQRFLKLSSL